MLFLFSDYEIIDNEMQMIKISDYFYLLSRELTIHVFIQLIVQLVQRLSSNRSARPTGQQVQLIIQLIGVRLVI